MPTNAKNLSRLPDPLKAAEARDRGIALEYVRRGEGPIAPRMAREMGKDHTTVYRALKKYLEWAREEVKKAKQEGAA